jgi:predicted nucleic acid-binding protein
MIYLETSVLVAALTREPATDRVLSWFSARSGDDLAVSIWGAAEFSAALSVKLRMGSINLDERAVAMAGFRRLIATSFEMFPVEGADFALAISLADQSELGLRAGDALHLAIARGRGAEICTLDRRLAEAAMTCGVGIDAIDEA